MEKVEHWPLTTLRKRLQHSVSWRQADWKKDEIEILDKGLMMRYARMYADQAGECHLEDIEAKFSETAHTPPAPPVDVAQSVDVTRHVMMRVPAGWAGDLHRAPRRQLMVMLSGNITVQASSGSTRELAAGDLLLLEDTVGKGHRTTNTGDGAAYVLMVHLA